MFQSPTIAQFWKRRRSRRTRSMITRQAQIIAYIDDFKLLMIATLVVIPLLIVFKNPSDGGADHTVVTE
jgi:DHA2 family multidrug resistance protein